MADNGSESLREFAGIIQEKAGPVPPKYQDNPERAPEHSGGMAALRSTLDRQPKMVIAGVAAGIGAAIGYLVGKLAR